MAESLAFTKTADRRTVYAEIIPQIESLIAEEPDLIANLANISAVLKEAFGFFWVGFYLKKHDQLVLGPFQGPLACTRIDLDKGVCGAAYTQREAVIVPDVDAFPGHIACSSLSRSEIVVPIFNSTGDVFAVLDVDSDKIEDFGPVDKDGLEQITRIVERSVAV
jgi:GAF domain-containing protein